MDLITIYKINNIMSMEPQFHLVDTPYNDLLITNFEEMIGSTKLFWKLKCASPKNIINIRKQHKIHEIIDLVNQLNVGIMELIKIDGCGKYVWFEYSEQFNNNLSNYIPWLQRQCFHFHLCPKTLVFAFAPKTAKLLFR